MAVSKGICYLCGKEIGKNAIKKHILSAHADKGQKCQLVKFEGYDNKNYWLYADMPTDTTLDDVDDFLRHIWLECCGHMGAFTQGDYEEINKRRKVSSFEEGDRILHEYDFGSTTPTLITFMGTTYRKKEDGIRLLARNVAPEFKCHVCGKKAELINTVEDCYENAFYCRECAEKDEEVLGMCLPVTNSPRMGVCGYDGELDTFYPPEPVIEKKK